VKSWIILIKAFDWLLNSLLYFIESHRLHQSLIKRESQLHESQKNPASAIASHFNGVLQQMPSSTTPATKAPTNSMEQ